MYQLYAVWVAALAVFVYWYFRRLYSTLQRAGVKCLPPLPLVGNMLDVVLQKEHTTDQFMRMCAGHDSERFVGKYEFVRPSLILLDTDLIRSIMVKDFDHFIDHRHLVDDSVDPLMGRILFNLKGQEWKHMRASLSPAFTSSKMKLMVPFMIDVGDQMMGYIKRTIENSECGYVDLEVLDLTTRFANDVIASCAFGTKVDSHNDADNYFYKIGSRTANLGYKEMIKFFGYASFPSIMRALNITVLSETAASFFRSLILSTMKTREEKEIVRNDMIHLLMEAKKGKLTYESNTSAEADVGFAAAEESTVSKKAVHIDWKDDDLVAQAVLFFLAGFDTTSTTMSWLLHELALNPDVQQRLHKEIVDMHQKTGGNFDYKAVQEMKYLDMVLSETLRKWPPIAMLDRVCTKDYNCGKPNDKAPKDYIVRKGESVSVPVWVFHRNPRYYPDPLKFDPERFSDQNRHKINPFVYMPFGLGPRNCVGSRFALYEIKVMVYKLLLQVEISPCEKTCVPEKLDNTAAVSQRLKGGYWLRFRLRN